MPPPPPGRSTRPPGTLAVELLDGGTISSCAARIIFSKRARMEEASSSPPSRSRVRASSRATSCSIPTARTGTDARRATAALRDLGRDTLRACSYAPRAGRFGKRRVPNVRSGGAMGGRSRDLSLAGECFESDPGVDWPGAAAGGTDYRG